jgi:aminoglycoside phosphotransferase (APT) family kinase protein
MLCHCTEPGDLPAVLELRQMPTAGHGFPDRRALADRYARRMGRDLSDFRFYRVLAISRLAVIFHQLHQRCRGGATQDLRHAAFGTLADGILDFALSVARGTYI